VLAQFGHCPSAFVAPSAFRGGAPPATTLAVDVSMIAHDDVFPFLNADRMVPPMSTTRSSIRAAGTRVAELAIELLAGRGERDTRAVAGGSGDPRVDRAGAGVDGCYGDPAAA